MVMTYAELARLFDLTDDQVDSDLRYIRQLIPDFAVNGIKIREVAYYAFYRAELKEDTKQAKRLAAVKALMAAYKQDMLENQPYKNVVIFE